MWYKSRQLKKTIFASSTLESNQGQNDGLFSQLPYKYHQNRVASVGDWLKICPWVTSRVAEGWWLGRGPFLLGGLSRLLLDAFSRILRLLSPINT